MKCSSLSLTPRAAEQYRRSSRRSFRVVQVFSVASLAGLLSMSSAMADTDHVRELAKNSTPVLIVVSGPDAEPIGHRLEEAIERSGDFKNRSRSSVQVTAPVDADRLLTTRQFSHASVIFLLSGSDPAANRAGQLSPSLQGLLPLKSEVIGSRLSIVRSGKEGAGAGSQEFRVGLYAPDADRLGRMYDLLVQRRVKNFRELPFVEAYRTNRIYVYSPPDYQSIFTGGWGQIDDPHVWNDVRWAPIGGNPPPPMAPIPEGTRVYFVDRQNMRSLPPDVATSLNPVRSHPNSVLAVHTISTSTAPRPPSLGSAQAIGLDDQYVLYSPLHSLLEARIRNHPSVFSLNSLPASQEIVDMRRAPPASVLVPGRGLPIAEPQVAAIADLLAGDTRDHLGLAVEPRSASFDRRSQDLDLASLEANPGDFRSRRSHFHSRYSFVFRMTAINGDTTFASNTRCLTPDLPAEFSEDEPVEPRHKNRGESDNDFNRRHGDWQDAHDRWISDRDGYHNRYLNEPCDWELSVLRQQHAHVHGTLTLWDFDAQGGARAVWSQETDRVVTDETVVRKTRAIVAGHVQKPRPLDTPPPSPTCGDALLTGAARAAYGDALGGFAEVALLPNGGEIATAQVVTPDPAPPVDNGAPAPQNGGSTTKSGQFSGKIADIDGHTITLTIGDGEGVNIGDYFSVALKTRDIKDPDTGEVKDVRVTDSVLIRVTKTGATADCVLASLKDAARFGEIQVGMSISKARRPLNP